MNRAAVIAILFLALTVPGCRKATVTALDIGSRLELLIDDYLVDRTAGAIQRHLHRPQPEEVSIVHDAPWEGSVRRPLLSRRA